MIIRTELSVNGHRYGYKEESPERRATTRLERIELESAITSVFEAIKEKGEPIETEYKEAR